MRQVPQTPLEQLKGQRRPARRAASSSVSSGPHSKRSPRLSVTVKRGAGSAASAAPDAASATSGTGSAVAGASKLKLSSW